MAQIKGKQIANASIAAAKVDLTDTFDFTSGSVSVATPSSNNDAANKAYVDAQMAGSSAGLDFKQSVKVASTGNFAGTYSANVITASSNGAISIDSVSLALNDRVLLKDQSTGTDNGIYYVSVVGDGSTAAQLTRATDADSSSDLTTGAFVFVEDGTNNQNRAYVLQAHTDGSSPTLDTDDLTFIQFSGAGQITAGDGLSKSADTLNLDIDGLGALSGSAVSADQLPIYDASATTPRKVGALTLLSDLHNTDEFTTASNLIALNLKTNGGLASSASGVEIDDAAMTTLTGAFANNTHSFVMIDSTRPYKITLNEMLSRLAGDGLVADTTNYQLDASVPALDSGSITGSISTDGTGTGITISDTPFLDSAVHVLVNGVGVEVGDGVKTKEVYFSSDGGTTARAIVDIASGDELIWNGSTHYTLESSDVVEIRYNA